MAPSSPARSRPTAAPRPPARPSRSRAVPCPRAATCRPPTQRPRTTRRAPSACARAESSWRSAATSGTCPSLSCTRSRPCPTWRASRSTTSRRSCAPSPCWPPAKPPSPTTGTPSSSAPRSRPPTSCSPRPAASSASSVASATSAGVLAPSISTSSRSRAWPPPTRSSPCRTRAPRNAPSSWRPGSCATPTPSSRAWAACPTCWPTPPTARASSTPSTTGWKTPRPSWPTPTSSSPSAPSRPAPTCASSSRP